MLRLVALSGLALLAACAERREEQQADAAKERSRPAVTTVIAQQYPGVSVTPLTTCVLENASEAETLALAQAALQGMSGRDTQMIRGIVGRPETRACAFDAGVTGYF